jgi:trehalose/maltose hydrolase-like predicted phosphorylase
MVIQDDEENRTRIQSSRFISMANPHLAAMQYSITPLNYAGSITVRSTLDGTIKNQGVKRYRELSSNHLLPNKEEGEGDTSVLAVKTNQSNIEIALGAKLLVKKGNQLQTPKYQVSTVPGLVSTTFEIEARSDSPINIEKLVLVYSSHLLNTPDPLGEVKKDLNSLVDYPKHLLENSGAWQKLWDQVDLKIKGDRLVQKMIRLHIYHSLISVSDHIQLVDAGVPARGLHGEAYRGHIFWDELYIMPFYDFHLPNAAKAALRYRYKRLPAAREAAKSSGLQGAEFPWQSGMEGTEETQRMHLNPLSGKWGPDYSHYQRHVSLAIAYNLWNYYWITKDIDFLEKEGAELLLSICLYWSSLAKKDPQTGRYSIMNVMGPDEFHETYPGSDQPGLKDNAYTNLMVVWLFEKAIEVLKLVTDQQQKSLLDELGISSEELSRWKDLSKNLTLSISESGILEQFAGYFDLEELDWEYYRNTYQDIHRMDRILKSEGLSPNAFKVAKQADCLMLFYNLSEEKIISLISQLGYIPPADLLATNLHYYLQRTSHGSTLSRLVHAYLAHQTGNYELSWKLYQEALRSDYLDIQGGTTREGIHLGVMTGTVLFAYRSYAGLDWSGKTLSINPRLPTGWQEMAFKVNFRNKQFHFLIKPESVKVKLEAKTPATIIINDQTRNLEPGIWIEEEVIRN